MGKRSSSNSPSPSANGQASRYASLSRVSNGNSAAFADVLPGMLTAAIDTVIGAGDLLSFSRTSDGGAICVFIKGGAEAVRCYCVVQEDLDRVLEQLANGQ